MNIDKQKLEENQAKNNQAQRMLDEELEEALKSEGDYIEPSDIPEEKKVEEPITIPDEDHEDEDIEEEKDEEIDNPKEPEKTPEEKPEVKEQPPKIERPQKYIPLQKYQEEKKQHQRELEEARNKIAELEKISLKNQSEEDDDEDLKKLAEKWDTPVDFIKELKTTLDKGNKIKPETIVEQDKIEEKPIAPKSQEEITELYEKEFDSFSPDLKKEYPNATPEQLIEAKKLMDELSHSQGFNNYPLDHILKINKGDFDEILTSAPDNPGIEGGRQGNSGFKAVSASSFKKDANGHYDFSTLHKMPDGEKKEELVDNLSLDAWEAYVQSLASNEELKVTKNDGKIVRLK